MIPIPREQRRQAEARRAPALAALRARGQRPEAARQAPEAGCQILCAALAKTARQCNPSL